MSIAKQIAFTSLSLILLFCIQGSFSQEVQSDESYYYTDFSEGTLPIGWKSDKPGYLASVVEKIFELSISKNASENYYTLGNLFVHDFDLRPYLTMRYYSEDTIQVGFRIFGPLASSSNLEVFTIQASSEWSGHTFNLSSLASNAWGNDLDSIHLLFAPGNPEYSGTFRIDAITIGDSVSGKIFNISHDQSQAFSVELGNDTLIHHGSSIMLDAGNPGKDFLWSTGETSQNILVDTAGMYSVTVIGKNNCTISDSIQVSLITGKGNIEPNDGYDLVIYPNPVRDRVYIKVADQLLGSMFMTADISGRVLNRSVLSESITVIDISQYSQGIIYAGIPGRSSFIRLQIID